jgi:serine/threonine-protein kinase HipA
MASLGESVIEQSIAVLGAQPKLPLLLIQEKLQTGNQGRLTSERLWGNHYILKPSSIHFSQVPENEHLTMHIAERSY